DVCMPGMDGFELCRLLQADAAISHIPIILFSSRHTTGYRVRGLETGAVDFLGKPLHEAELLARIQTHLRLARGQRLLSEEDLALERDLREAIQRQQLLLHFQPVAEVDGLGLVGAEALLRWRHPVHGMVPPERFIPIAETSHLILEI